MACRSRSSAAECGELRGQDSRGSALITEPQTYSSGHLRRFREAHRTDAYGRHRHLYLHDAMREIATSLRSAKPTEHLSWLDYGCGKGGFIDEVRPLGLFATIVGYDPAVEAFHARPDRRFDAVTCLDVLDIVEPRFLSNVLADVAALTDGVALFDCLCRPKPGTPLRPHPPFYWSHLVGQHMSVAETKVEFSGMDGFERAIIRAMPRPSPPR
ncbi:MAG: methyltransferase domain-containing protein [Acetobacteraceae bacterium]